MESGAVSAEVVGVSFGVYTEEEIRKLSVKEITNPTTFTVLGQPVSGGLYDATLGPLDRQAGCVTCGLSERDCPGHMGHIELAVPLYNPVFFKNMFTVLRSICLVCGHFAQTDDVKRYIIEKLKLLRAGHLCDAMELVPHATSKKSKSKSKKSKSSSSDDDDDSKDNDDEYYAEEESTMGTHKELMVTMRELLVEYARASCCAHCNAPRVKLKQEASTKVYQDVPTAKLRNGLKRWSEVQKKNGGRGVLPAQLVSGGSRPRLMTPLEVRGYFQSAWSHDVELATAVWGVVRMQDGVLRSREADHRIFFLQVLPVPPSRFRPANKASQEGSLLEHPQTSFLAGIIRANRELVKLYRQGEDGVLNDKALARAAADAERSASMDDADLNVLGRQGGKKARVAAAAAASTLLESKLTQWVQMQSTVNALMEGGNQSKLPSIKQQLEKKEGMFRLNMMGKRVNFAARSVISPDPFIGTHEIGIPQYFAKRLTYPQPVTPWNFDELQRAVINGPDQHPGANAIEDEWGNRMSLEHKDRDARVALAKTLRTLSAQAPIGAVKKVLRHLRTGDVVIVNRQPTLHKPSMMTHRARVILNDEKPFRLHYANCKSYNADFDGDEMNVHFPQDELSRAEAYTISCTDEQYSAPTDGSPLRGLIQDNICCGILLTKRDTFFERDQFQQLVYAATFAINETTPLRTSPPALLKPRPLWTGKQVISTVLQHMTIGRHAINVECKTKIAEAMWGERSGEGVCVVRNGELLAGVLEKNQFGASRYGLVHACHELYSPRFAGQLLTVLSRLFTIHMQQRGFTCGIDDLVLQPSAEVDRQALIDRARPQALAAAAKFIEAHAPEHAIGDIGGGGVETAARASDGLREALLVDIGVQEALFDSKMKAMTHDLSSQVVKRCLPHGQMKMFPDNNLSLMTMSGAKGSTVNFSQISCLLGQQELEGRRCPRMVSGRTLPCFEPYDTSARAGGFIGDRFLTGIRPQEYYFHCFTDEDTQVLTSCGFLFRDELLSALARDRSLLVAAYDLGARAIVYERPRHVVDKPRARYDAIELTSANEAPHWNEGASDEYGQRVRPSKMTESNGVSIRVTGGHDMFVRLGRAANCNANDVEWTRDFAKVKARDLMSSDPRDAIKLLAAAENGVVADRARVTARVPTLAALGLGAEHADDFLQLYGYWLGNGALSFRQNDPNPRGCDAVIFSPRKCTDKQFLDRVLPSLGLVRGEHFVSYDTSEDRRLYLIGKRCWVVAFFDQYASKYNGLKMAAGYGSFEYPLRCLEAHERAPSYFNAKSAKWCWHWVWRLNRDEMRHVLAGVTRANGTRSSKAWTVYTPSPTFRDELVRMVLHAGYTPHFGVQWRAGTVQGTDGSDKIVADHDNWSVHISSAAEQVLEPSVRACDVRRFSYCGRVWCLNMPSGTLVARRAHKDERGVVTKASRALVVGNCMAGREGLVDTAVKTANSGYLQRCLIKQLETLRVEYDHTVRSSDGSLIQFRYGEDSLDPTKTQFLEQFKFIARNFDGFAAKYNTAEAIQALDVSASVRAQRAINKQRKRVARFDAKRPKPSVRDERGKRCTLLPPQLPDPLLFQLSPSRNLGVVSDRFEASLSRYLKEDPDCLFASDSDDGEQEGRVDRAMFRALMYLKYMRSMVDPGEAVGLLASQSIGEPSTQMTLNTFHLAGRGEANVTLGIPRLREIIMSASQSINTPLMNLPLLPSLSDDDARRLGEKLKRLTLAEFVDDIVVRESLAPASRDEHGACDFRRRYITRLSFDAVSFDEHQISESSFFKLVEHGLLARIVIAVSKKLKSKSKARDIGVGVDITRFEPHTGQQIVEAGAADQEQDSTAAREAARKRNVGTYDDRDDEAAQQSSDDSSSSDSSSSDSSDGDSSDSDDEKEKRTSKKTKKAKKVKEVSDDDDADDELPLNDDSEEELEPSSKLSKVRVVTLDTAKSQTERRNMAMAFVESYTVSRRDLYLEVTMELPPRDKILMLPLVEQAVDEFLVRHTPGVANCFVNTMTLRNGDKRPALQTEGVNLSEIFDPTGPSADMIDANRVYTNDIGQILHTYGVEAARQAIVDEVTSVFAVYGIAVDPRHLNLVADYMTNRGGYNGFNRVGIASQPSPLLKASFESTMAFIRESALTSERDTLKTPASCIVVGRVVRSGTGAFDLLQSL
jgi:DNA-directed RNA polymerase beta' subunit